MPRLRSLFALALPLIGLAACMFNTDNRPPVTPDSVGSPYVAKPPSPEIERWFRASAPSSGMRLAAGDRISISVQGNEDLKIVRDVPPDGSIPVYLKDRTVEVVNARGKTPQELEKAVADVHRKDLGNPYVTVSVEAAAPRSISVLGSVKNQNVYPVSANDRITILQALALAGGWAPQSDLRQVTIQRVYPATGEMVSSPPLDLQTVIDKGDQRDNLVVEAGDVIVVPDLQESRVQVLGMVEKPGGVIWSKGMTLARAISEAGGFKKFARTDRIKVVRHGRENIFFDFDAMLDDAGENRDLELEPRDVIYVDQRWY